MSTAAERWRLQLEAWALPEELLAAAEESPYSWPVELWKRRSAAALEEREEPFTAGLLRRLLPAGGSLLDIGAGTGRASLPIAGEGHPLRAVEKDAAMAGGLREEAAAAGVAVEVVQGTWPEVAPTVGQADVVLSAHVVYDVAPIVPFLRAMSEKASVAVVIEMTETHPWSDLAPLYRALHRLERPAGPTVDDLVAVVHEELGLDPELERWERAGALWFRDWEEILGFYGRRLALPRRRWSELRELLEADVVLEGERIHVGGRTRELATVWWKVPT